MSFVTEKEICYKIYCDAFGEDEFSIELFEKCYEYCHFYKVSGRIVSIMFLFPCEIFLENKVYKANYVFAVTTDKDCRCKALELLRERRGMKITDAAMRCGFGSMNTFYRTKSRVENSSFGKNRKI